MAWMAFTLLGSILFFIYSIAKPTANELSAKPGVGVIERRFQRDGFFQFYVEFTTDTGETHLGKSESYIAPKDKYYKGDRVNIRYYFTPKGRPRVKMEEPDIKEIKSDFAKTRKKVFVASIICFVMACFSFFVQVIL